VSYQGNQSYGHSVPLRLSFQRTFALAYFARLGVGQFVTTTEKIPVAAILFERSFVEMACIQTSRVAATMQSEISGLEFSSESLFQKITMSQDHLPILVDLRISPSIHAFTP
jgi:hypothetical protein